MKTKREQTHEEENKMKRIKKTRQEKNIEGISNVIQNNKENKIG